MADQQPEALAATCDLLVQQFTAFGADKKAVKEALTASAATIRTLRAQVERLQAAGQVPLGYMNAGHLHEMRQGRLPHAYLYPTEGVGVSVPVYTTPAQEAADTGADDRAQIEKIARAHGTGGWQTLDDMVRFGLAVRAALAARAGQVAAPAMVPQGWCLNSADFSLQCSDPTRTGTVMLIRDIAGRKAWHALQEDEAVSVNGPPLYITGRGMTFSEALEDAAKLAERTVGINGLTVGGSKSSGGAE